MNSHHEENLKTYLKAHIPAAEHMSFNQSCHSVADAADAANASPEEFVKNVCMIGSNGDFIVAIVHGTDRASTSRVGKALGTERPRLATAEEILEKTGYPCGGTPSFGYNATFLIDPRVAEIQSVITGGGSECSLVRVKTNEMLHANNGRIVRVRK
ncbi:aminoacyl-tRNA deacylase [Halodesulfovibrio spirochaetisodalis]|uniref:Prolyl-tRNA synthetase n=1 Tax=Halodesulfovibrio spirochaetisodalis TaxID=1560234 RepID=A0A1B7XH72_9BACT|nr:YbaK/EbsC family protein [Halodesulfovibrio spirochaetisodalis]OBQ54873.1 prolyl-tRNA synthetase [Halodesulfovibrio spirochaetisodalis]